MAVFSRRLVWGQHEQVDLDGGRDPPESDIWSLIGDDSGALQLESGDYGIYLQPEQIDPLDGSVGCIIGLLWQLLPQNRASRRIPSMNLIIGKQILDAKHICRNVMRSVEVLVEKGGLIEHPNSVLAELGLSEGKLYVFNPI